MKLEWSVIDPIIKDVLLNDVEAAQMLQGVDMKDKEAVKAYLEQEGVLLVESTMQTTAMVEERLQKYEDTILALIGELSDDFIDGKGGGMSLMNLVVDKHGNQWGEQWQADLFFALAKGLSLARFCLPREMWSSLPGGMPYVSFRNKE